MKLSINKFFRSFKYSSWCRYITIPVLLVLVTPNFAQVKSQWISAFTAFGSDDLYRSGKIVGLGHNDGKGYNAYGVMLTINKTRALGFETGLVYSRYRFEAVPMIYPGQDASPTPFVVTTLTVPFYFKLTFLRYFYTSVGPALNLDTGGGEHTSLGLDWAVGANIIVKQKFRFFISPYVHNLADVRFPGNSLEHLMESGWRMGVGYRIPVGVNKSTSK